MTLLHTQWRGSLVLHADYDTATFPILRMWAYRGAVV
jgi:hypothetical protein